MENIYGFTQVGDHWIKLPTITEIGPAICAHGEWKFSYVIDGCLREITAYDENELKNIRKSLLTALSISEIIIPSL